MQIVNYPHPSLTRPTKKIKVFDDELRARVEDMYELMDAARGVGLAAPQVDWSVRLFVINPTGEEGDRQVFINPKLKRVGDRLKAEEGCLSLPNITCKVSRHERVEVTAQDLEGNWFEATAEQLPARIIQHEYDHLEGILIINKASPAEKIGLKKKLKVLRQEYRRQREELEAEQV